MFSKLISKMVIKVRYALYRMLWDCREISGVFRYKQAVLIAGSGSVSFGKNVVLGYSPSPYRYSGYIYIEARSPASRIVFGDNVSINNNCTFISDGAGIRIGNNVLVGTQVEFYDSDFHELSPDRRHIAPVPREVVVCDNVFIGSNAVVLKGVTIGKNSVVANSAVVTSSVPENSIVGGNPARVIGSVQSQA